MQGGALAETRVVFADHVIADRTEAAYRRGDLFEKRSNLMKAWAAYCQTEANLTGAVVPIKRAKTS